MDRIWVPRFTIDEVHDVTVNNYLAYIFYDGTFNTFVFKKLTLSCNFNGIESFPNDISLCNFTVRVNNYPKEVVKLVEFYQSFTYDPKSAVRDVVLSYDMPTKFFSYSINGILSILVFDLPYSH